MKSFIIQNTKFWLDDWLYKNMDIVLNKAVPNNWDALFILFGREGVGKSTLASQLALYLDHNFDVENIVFTPDQFTKAIDNSKEGQAIVWDEAITGANINQHASEISISIISKLTQIRKKKLKLILCFPYLYMLNKYFVSRSIASIYIYAKSFDKRGYAFFYSSNQTEHLYNYMKEKFRYHYKGAINVCNKSFYFMFDKTFCADVEAYENKKDKALVGIEQNTKKDLWRDRCRLVCDLLYTDYGVKKKTMAKMFGITEQALYSGLWKN